MTTVGVKGLTGVVHFGAKFGDERVDRCKLNFNAIWERHGAVECKIKSANIFCRLTTMQEGLHTSRSHVGLPRVLEYSSTTRVVNY